jgi:hypothetical protein
VKHSSGQIPPLLLPTSPAAVVVHYCSRICIVID